MSSHPLDRPPWHALTSHQAYLAEGHARAWRFEPDHAPFAAAADASVESMSALAALIPADRELWMVEAGEPLVPPDTALVSQASCVQMVAKTVPASEPHAGLVPLGEADAPAMQELAALTRPGPFRAKTHRLSPFLGVKVDNKLVAMAGERLHLTGYAEVSGVCTHPDHRGRGYAGLLMRAVMTRIASRGEQPFLTAYSNNLRAIALYETLGFRTRTIVTATVLRAL